MLCFTPHLEKPFLIIIFMPLDLYFQFVKKDVWLISGRPRLSALGPEYLETEPMSAKFENLLRPMAFPRLPHIIRRGFFS